MRPQSRKLLLNPSVVRRGHNGKVQWVFDGSVMARVELFKNPPATDAVIGTQNVRDLLNTARAGEDLGEVSPARKYSDPDSDGRVLLVTRGGALAVMADQTCVLTWLLTACVPTVTTKGVLLWWGKVRGQRALFGFVMPVRVW